MKLLLNLIWLLFGGLWLALGYVLFGILACIAIITIPFGIASFRMASVAFWPFGKTVIEKPEAGAPSCAMNVIWFVIAGFWLALGHLATAVAQAITIIGIPLAIGNLKMLPVTCVPFGKTVVSSNRVPPDATVYYRG